MSRHARPPAVASGRSAIAGGMALLLAAVLLASASGAVSLVTSARAHAATPAATASAAASQGSAAAKALDYLHACQNSDGGFSEKGSNSSDAITAWAIFAIAAAGEDPNQWRPAGVSPVEYLAKQSSRWRQTTDVARTILAAVAAGANPRDFGGVNLVERLRSASKPAGSGGEHIGPYVNSHIWAMIALAAAGEAPSGKHAEWLIGEQNADGGWGWASGLSSDTNDTAAALHALAAAGVPAKSEAMSRALGYLRARQADDGGFIYTSGSSGDANSTAWVVQGLIACGQSPEDWRTAGRGPHAFLSSLQTAEGYFRSSKARASNPLLTTVQVIPALCDRTFSVTPAGSGSPSGFKPVISITSPAAGATVAGDSAAALAFTVTDGAGTGVKASAVTVRVDGEKRTASVTGATGRVSLAGLAPGEHTVAITATDRAGNTSTLPTHRFTVAALATVPTPPSATGGAADPAVAAAAAGDGSAAASASIAAPTPGSPGDGAGMLATGVEVSAAASGSAASSGAVSAEGSASATGTPASLWVWWGAVLVVSALAVTAVVWIRRRGRGDGA